MTAEKILWKGRPYLPAFAMRFAFFIIMGAGFVYAYGRSLPYYFQLREPIFQVFNPFGWIFFIMFLIPVLVGLGLVFITLTVLLAGYQASEYVITKNAVLSNSWSTFDMGPVRKRYMNTRLEKITILKKDILNVEIQKTIGDRMFGTGSIWIYQASGLYIPSSGYYRVTVLKNIKNAQKVASLIK